MDDIDKLTKNTHLSYGAAQSLLNTRTLSGDPSQHESTAIIVTEDEVVVETDNMFSSGRKIPSPIELALTTGQTVEQIRKDFEAAAQLSSFEED